MFKERSVGLNSLNFCLSAPKGFCPHKGFNIYFLKKSQSWDLLFFHILYHEKWIVQKMTIVKHNTHTHIIYEDLTLKACFSLVQSNLLPQVYY
jgi:hypothetical protein